MSSESKNGYVDIFAYEYISISSLAPLGMSCLCKAVSLLGVLQLAGLYSYFKLVLFCDVFYFGVVYYCLFVNMFYFDFAAAASLAHPSTNALFTRSQLASV